MGYNPDLCVLLFFECGIVVCVGKSHLWDFEILITGLRNVHKLTEPVEIYHFGEPFDRNVGENCIGNLFRVVNPFFGKKFIRELDRLDIFETQVL